MTSLSETYGKRGRSEVHSRRLYVGVGLFVGGALLLVAGILTAAEVLAGGAYSSGVARRYGGILGGLGVPFIMLGIMTVLPADRNTRAAAVVGAAIMALGVALFAHAYPAQWVGGPRPDLIDLTLPTAGVYFLGAATTLWCLFVGVANFKTRNDPGGTVTMEVTHKGETKVIEVSRDQLGGLGGVGLLGGTPDGNVETQTNRPRSGTTSREKRSASGGSADLGTSGGVGIGGVESHATAGMSDGGNATPDITSPLDDGPAAPRGPKHGHTSSPRDGPGDTYCGNCAEFDYLRTENGMAPYCGLYDEVMDDMDACEEWTPR